MIKLIPVNHSGDRTLSIALGDNLLSIRTTFNSVINYWMADFFTDTDTPIVQGATCKVGVNLLGPRPHLAHQYGYFVMSANALGRESLGTTAYLLWLSKDDYQALTQTATDVTLQPLTYDFDALYPPADNTENAP